LKKIFHSILAVGELPTEWQETKVVFIPKAGKATYITAKDLRPISLTSFLLKSFERIINHHGPDTNIKRAIYLAKLGLPPTHHDSEKS